MKANKRRLIFCAIWAVTLIIPFRLSAQKLDISDLAGNEAAEEEPEEEESIYGDEELNKPANEWPKGDYVAVLSRKSEKSNFHLGPTGLWVFTSGQNIWVRKVVPGSPADGKVLPGDIIYGIEGRTFPKERDVRYYFAMSITKAETQEAGGQLILDIRRDGTFIQVPITLKVMGSFSATTPWNCEKSRNIVAAAEEYLRKGLRPETGMPDNNKYMYGTFRDSVLFLMASGNPELQGLVRRHMHGLVKSLDALKAGDGKSFNADKGYGYGYAAMLLGEYYHLTGDPTVLPHLTIGNNGNDRDWSWPPQGPSRYGLYPHSQMPGVIGLILANEAGVDINQQKLLFDLNYLNVKRAEYGSVKYCAYAPKPIEARQVKAPLEITAEEKATGTYSNMNGKLGTAAALFSLVPGYEKTVEACATRCVYSFSVTHKGHGGVWFNGFWSPIGALHAGQEKASHFMKGQQWWRELYRDHTGAMWQTGNAKGKQDVFGTGFAIHRVMHKKRLRILGAPRSYFCAAPPPSMKPALAAHRNRDYAKAETLVRELLASGKVPAHAKDRVNHFLNSVRTLKESIEHDLTFTEGLVKKGNYTLASVELEQLQMVVSPDNARLKAIVSALESTKAQAQIASAIVQFKKNRLATMKEERKEFIESVDTDTKSIVTLVRDGTRYKGARISSRGGHLEYASFSKDELNTWRWVEAETLENPPQGWTNPTFDDSKWQEASLPTKNKGFKLGALMRTRFEVKDPGEFKILRVRGRGVGYRNLTIYLNGEAVAKVIPTYNTAFELAPEALKLLKRGKNTMAMSVQRDEKARGFSFRLEGILKTPTSPEADRPSYKDSEEYKKKREKKKAKKEKKRENRKEKQKQK